MSAREAKLFRPISVFVSSNEEIYIADSANHRIRKILRNGNIVTIAGNGEQGYSGDNGPATMAKVNCPQSVFVSSDDEVYIADTYNHRIRKILRNGNIITIAGTGQEGCSGDNVMATMAKLNFPRSVFVSSTNEVYFSDTGNNRIRKILQNGNIVTIAGTGESGFGGDNGPATMAKVDYARSIFVSSNDEVYIADTYNHRIRKILRNGNIVTIAGTGEQEYSGDNGPATMAKVSYPRSVFVSSNDEIYIVGNKTVRKILHGNIITIAGNLESDNDGDNILATKVSLSPEGIFVTSSNEVYIADYSNHKVRKILRNGNIITIAGTGEEGYSGDSEFDISLHPHIGGNIYSKKFKIGLKKHSRDVIFNSSIIAFIPLLEKLSPLFCKCVLKNQLIITKLNSAQQEITQKLIDSLIYNNDFNLLEFNEILNVLLILGLFKNNEFIGLKQSLTSHFIQSITLENLSKTWEQVDNFSSQSRNEFHSENYILELLNNYCIEFAAVQMKTPGGVNALPTLPIIVKNASNIFSKMTLSKPIPIILHDYSDEKETEIEPTDIETLYNDEKTSDLKIEIGQEKYLYCHKTILSSSSTLFNAMLNSGSTFTDLNNDIFIPDSDDDLELLQIIVKSCYGIQIDNVKHEKLISLLDMAIKHEFETVIGYCKNHILITIENYFDIISACQNYFDLPCFERFYNEFLKFGIENRKRLFYSQEVISKLPPKLWQAIFLILAQE